MPKPVPATDREPRALPEARQVSVAKDSDIVTARQNARELAAALGFTPGEATIIATAISELARNIVDYAKRGSVTLRPVECNGRVGLAIVADDQGPGIANLDLAMRDGFSTAGRLGIGLPGVRRLMDEFEIESNSGAGTTVTVTKWNSWTRP